ncbi:MAG: hypothetical protein ABEJ79_07580 [Halolamina sp.]
MLEKLGAGGVVGLLLVVAGLAVLGVHSLYAAAGLALVLSGIGFVARGLIQGIAGAFGMA